MYEIPNYSVRQQSSYGPGALLGAALIGAGVVWIGSSLGKGGGHREMHVHSANKTINDYL